MYLCFYVNVSCLFGILLCACVIAPFMNKTMARNVVSSLEPRSRAAMTLAQSNLRRRYQRNKNIRGRDCISASLRETGQIQSRRGEDGGGKRLHEKFTQDERKKQTNK